jgi:hypothetical protein
VITAEVLSTIRVLWRQPDVMSLWGIPYEMRPGQAPRDLWRAATARYENPHGWIYLGTCGWFASLTEPEIDLIKTWEKEHRANIPEGPGEWSHA